MRNFSETEAAKLAGVSSETIREFYAVGLLEGENVEGGIRFSRDALDSVFGSTKSPDELTSDKVVNRAVACVDSLNSSTSTPITSQAPTAFSPLSEKSVPSATGSSQRDFTQSQSTQSEMRSGSASVESEAKSVKIGATKEQAPIIEHKSFELLELNQSLKEQIETLREERDWLRKRVELLEIRTERDQMLLLSESRNVQQLLPKSRSNFWTFALPWLKEK